MRSRRLVWALPAIVLLLVAAQKEIRLMDGWFNPEVKSRKYRKVMVVGIAEDRQVRHHFENKFVSHLRARGLQGVTSYSLVPDLTHIEAEDQILREMREQEIDAVLTVRVVAMEKSAEADWSEAWGRELESDIKIRELIQESLPVPQTRKKHYGAEAILWEFSSGTKVWGGRSGVFTRKMAKQGNSGLFITGVMNTLYDNDRL